MASVRATPETFAPVKFNCYVLINHFSKLEFCFQKVPTQAHTFLAFSLQYNMNVRFGVISVWA